MPFPVQNKYESKLFVYIYKYNSEIIMAYFVKILVYLSQKRNMIQKTLVYS